MSLDTLYRLFFHLTLALSSACLLQAERPFLPQPEMAIPLVASLVFLAMYVEKRWTMPDSLANLLGVLIAAGGIAWMVKQVYDPTGAIVIPLPTGLVPHIGPIMIALLLVKLYRPRQPNDFWVFQAMGLLQVALACALATEPRFGFYFACYILSGLTCLGLASVHTAETVPNAALRTPSAPFLLRPLLWMLLVTILGGLAFLAAPRGNLDAWHPLKNFGIPGSAPRTQTGYVETMDLTKVGEINADDAVAFRVEAVDIHGQPKTDLGTEVYWRGRYLDHYEQGRWTVAPQVFGFPRSLPRFIVQTRLPDEVGPDRFYLVFHVKPSDARGLFLAQPIVLGITESPAGGPTMLPVLSETQGTAPLFFRSNGTLIPTSNVSARREYIYRQVTRPMSDSDVLPANNLDGNYVRHTLVAPESVPTVVAEWTDQLLERLAAERRFGLRPEDLPRNSGYQPNETGFPMPRSARRIAHALCNYLATSGEFGYTRELYLKDSRLDPTADFLLNVKSGHCERFASALTLMLRSCKIPARIVMGFHGAEDRGDGTYNVCQYHAHSWVEALVPREGGDSLAPASWMHLDPTPATEAPRPQTFSFWRWIQHQWQRSDVLWRELILGLNSDTQADFWSGLVTFRGPIPFLLRWTFLAVVAYFAFMLGKRLWRMFQRWRITSTPALPHPTWLVRLFDLLARHFDLRPAPDQTPREFAASAGARLRENGTGALADLPSRLVELFYRMRYGHRPLEDAERGRVEAELTQLELALRG